MRGPSLPSHGAIAQQSRVRKPSWGLGKFRFHFQDL